MALGDDVGKNAGVDAINTFNTVTLPLLIDAVDNKIVPAFVNACQQVVDYAALKVPGICTDAQGLADHIISGLRSLGEGTTIALSFPPTGPTITVTMGKGGATT
jgi:hypothetical protein